MSKNLSTETGVSKKVVAALTAAGLVAGGLVGAAVNASMDSSDFTQAQIDSLVANASAQAKSEYAKGFLEGQASVDIPVVEPVVITNNVTEFVEVDNENLQLVLEHIYDNDGDVEYLTEDLKESEVAQIVDRVIFINEVKALALAETKKEILDLVDKEIVNGNEIDEDDVERVRYNDDADEITVDDIDFDDKDAEAYVSGTFEHDDIKYEFVVKVIFKDGEVDDIELDSLVEA